MQNKQLRSDLKKLKFELEEKIILINSMEKHLKETEENFNKIIFETQSKCRLLESQLEENYLLFKQKRVALMSEETIRELDKNNLWRVE